MRQSLRSQGKGSKKSSGAASSAVRWAFAWGAAAFLAWAVLFPALAGWLGQRLDAALGALLGGARFLLPPLFAHLLLRRWRLGKDAGSLTVAAGSAAALAALSCLLALGAGFWSAGGGALGSWLSVILAGGLGTPGAFAAGLLALLLSLQIAVGIRWGLLAAKAWALAAEDFTQWRQARVELSRRSAEARSAAKSAVVPRKAEPALNGSPAPQPRPTPVEIKAPAAKTSPKGGRDDAHPRVEPPAGSPYLNYQLPPLSLLKAPPAASERGRPPQAEIDASIAHLEATLKSFGVEAHVTGYAPGPVITRYELSPAPGVKVSAIVALENDLALAMKAKGIRIIAPIPGKAAVGIEIPNAKPAMVVLRDILESDAIPPGAPPLTFGLGLSAAGEPRSADIAKMPHVLVAGATNSGKSVMIHAMILSILFRARPDEVKFLMIDPKRLELTFYDGIPHLFDPTASPDKVTVATNSKDAAKSLTALVRLMEKRYEKFQLYSVRNIEGYNAEADKRKQPREFYIVVVIDELADLMLVAGDQVEDAIQRLTQMARAVGIHLVLATQRPSVDVITGVIKANLPARLALQVISKVDSKVILDTQGAESLQGRGDLLYLAAGAQKPERCQGAFVSEDEIRAVAAHLKAQGKPDYPMLETMAAKGAADDLSSLGVEPLEFSQALKLVLERRRVSQDLLKSQFGSSARATNILSALEVKELIRKPEGSNRWEIHFDAIEDYLRSHFPQVPLDGRS